MKFLLFLLISPYFLLAQYSTIGNGNWSDPSIWNLGNVPPTWGNYTVNINHTITMDISPQGADWQLFISAGAALQASNCQTLTSWGNSIWINHGTLSCHNISTPGRVENFGTLQVTLVRSGYSSSTWINHKGAVWTSQELSIVNNSTLTNYGEINIQGNPSSCHSPNSIHFLFAADSLFNHGIINTTNFESSSNSTYLYNADSARISLSSDMDITAGSHLINRGTIETQGSISISEGSAQTQVNNYGLIFAHEDIFNYGGVEFYNYGCDCYPGDKGEIVANRTLANHGLLENHGRARSQGVIENYSNLGTTDCGHIEVNGGSGTVHNYGTARLFGPLIICATLNANTSSVVDPAIDFSCPSLTPCPDPILLQLETFDIQKQSKNEVLLSWSDNEIIEGTQYSIERSPNGLDWSMLDVVYSKPAQKKYSYTDYTPNTPLSYYRIKIIPSDGHSFYTDIKVLEIHSSVMHIYPNPSASFITLESEVDIPTPILYNSFSQQVDVPIERINHSFQLDLRELPSGLYIIKTIWSKAIIQKI